MRGCRPLTEGEVEVVLEKLSGGRDRAMLLLGVKSGFRISEILSLRVGDVVQAGRIATRINVRRRYMKRKTEGRAVLLHPAAREALATWIEELRARGHLTAESFVFQSRTGANRPIHRGQAWRILRRAFARAGA